MFSNAGSLIFYLFLALALLLLPGMALLRLCVPRRSLGVVCRLCLAPGLTIALAVLLFTWCNLLSLQLGALSSWLLVAGALLVLLFFSPVFPSSPDDSDSKNPQGTGSDWLAGTALLVTLVVLLIVRFKSTWGWCVPPGFDTAQHTIIVQLLLDHHGLFQSWAPYNDAETFTYHFGFHSVVAFFAWISGLDAASSVLIMARLMAASAAAALFALVRLWTRSAWGGVFAVLSLQLYLRNFYAFDIAGRWTLLAGLPVITAALVLWCLYLQSANLREEVGLGVLCALITGGLVLAQYKSAIIFAILAASLVCGQLLARFLRARDNRLRVTLQMTLRVAAVIGLALFLAAPRLYHVMEARTGHHLKRLVLESRPAAANTFEQPTLNRTGMLRFGFVNRRDTVLSGIALLGALFVVTRRRQALWFLVGWGIVCVVMNPALIGIDRIGLIDEEHWRYSIHTAFAAMVGLAVGLVCEASGKTSSSFLSWSLLGAVIGLGLWDAVRQPALPDICRYVLPADLRLSRWIEQNVPNGEMIAGRVVFEHGLDLGRDAANWLPYFTRHQTNQTYPAAALEKGNPESRERLKAFTRDLYARDMSCAESAGWMRSEGFRWFYVGALDPKWDAPLLDQLGRNSAFEVRQAEDGARIYHLR